MTNLYVQQVSMCKRDMFLAIQGEKANLSTIRKLIRVNGFDLDSEIGPIPIKDRSGRSPKFHTALTWASWQGNLSVVKCLISEGADPHALTSQGLAAIHCCSMKNDNDHLSVVKYFLEHPRLKIDINFCNDQDGTTPLMYACSFGSYTIADYLLQHNAEINRQDVEGKSAIFYAVRGGHLDLVKLLVAHDACIYLRDNNNATVLHHLLMVYLSSNMTLSTLSDILTYLVDEKGLSVSSQTIDGNTVLHEACRCGLTDVVGYLLEKGADIEAKKNGWETPLWSLVMGKFPRYVLIMLLLEQGANFEARHCLGITLLQYARQLSKNGLLIKALEDAYRTLRARRMKVLLAKRKAVLNFAGTSPNMIAAKSSYALVSIQKDGSSNNENNNHEGDADHHSSEGPGEEVLERQANNVTKNNYHHQDACSDISSDSLLSEISAEEHENEFEIDDFRDVIDPDDGSPDSDSTLSEETDNDRDISGPRQVGDSEEDEEEEEQGNEESSTPDEETTSTTENETSSTLTDENSSVSSEDDDDDDDGDSKDNDHCKHDLIDTDINEMENEVLCEEDEKDKCDEGNAGKSENEGSYEEGELVEEVPSSSSAKAKSNANSVDVADCFERLLRKKRQFEKGIHQNECFAGNNGQKENMVPQKIMCVRRLSFISSDSD